MVHKTKHKTDHVLPVNKMTLWLLIGGVVIVLVLVGISIIGGVQKKELYQWRQQLSTEADEQTRELQKWVKQQEDVVQDLAKNMSLQLYMTELEQFNSDAVKVTDGLYQLSYLRNLLEVRAMETKFWSPSLAASVGANINVRGNTGLALIDKNQDVVAATAAMPALEGELKKFLEHPDTLEPMVSNIYLSNSGDPVVAFKAPVFAVQAEARETSKIGTVVGVKDASSMFLLLRQPSTMVKTKESLLVSQQDGFLVYATPTMEEMVPLSKRVEMSDPELDVVFAYQNIGKVAVMRDQDFNEVLVTGRKIENTPWVLVHKVSMDVVLAGSGGWVTWILIGVAVVLALAGLGAVLWYVTVLRKTKEVSQDITGISDYKEMLLAVIENKMGGIFAVDESGHCCFANQKMLDQLEIPLGEIQGKPLSFIVGKEDAAAYSKVNRQVLEKQQMVTYLRSNTNKKIKQSYIEVSHIPLKGVPIGNKGKIGQGVLVIEEDVTHLLLEKEKQHQADQALINTLVSVMDSRDPYTKNHSTRVVSLACAIAVEMDLPEEEVIKIQSAGRLMNVSRMFVGLEVLNKGAKLSNKEKSIIESAKLKGPELFEAIELQEPIADIIRHAYEHVDGSGMLGLKGEEILVQGRILAVANSFISMRSPRSYRLLKTLDETLAILIQEAGSHYDKSVVAALVHYIENRGGRQIWKDPEEIPALWFRAANQEDGREQA